MPRRTRRSFRGRLFRQHRRRAGPGHHAIPRSAASRVPAGAARLPLSLVAPGETVTLVGIQDCARLRQRVADLGLNIGLTVRVVKNDYHGPLILAVKTDTRLALGRGLAHRIHVQNTTEDTSLSTQER